MPDWRTLIPADWSGECVVCGERMTVADVRADQVVAVGDQRGVVACHVRHITAGGEEYERTVRLMAEATVRRVRSNRR